MRGFRIWGLLPAQLLMLLTLILPIGIILVLSFATRGSYGGFEWKLSFDAYRQILFVEDWGGGLEFNPQYLKIIGRTILLAASATLICMTIALPVAYWITRQKGRRKTLLIFLVTLPFWVSMIVRVYAWSMILGNNGVIEQAARALGLTDDMPPLLFNNTAMLIGMVYSYIPLMILPVYSSIEKLDANLIEASHDLHASRWVTLRRIILPLTWPGLMGGALLVFVPCLGAVLEPQILGGGRILLMGTLIQMQFGGARNWPFGAAVAIVLMALVMLYLLVSGLRNARRAVEEIA